MFRYREYFAIPVLALAIAAALPAAADAQNFGKNKVNYTAFDWQYIPTENFDIYYTGGGYETARIAAEFAEKYYQKLSVRWDYTLQKRIPLLIHNSHNDFAQTNVLTELIDEGTGGFTELFKNRVVIPWEGSLDKFKHVIDHELTHAIMFDMLYGGLIESVLGREYLFQMPLWFAEGLAEHESQYWSTEGDMIVRDAIISGYLPEVQNMYSGYMVYKGGESFFRYIQEKYGSTDRWVAGELLHSLRNTKDVNQTFKAVLGKSVDDLSKEWQRALRDDNWPEVEDREIPEDFATRLTDHMELQNYENINPTFNPTGDKIAFLTDRNDYREVMLMSAIDGRILDTIVRGEKAGDYEEMHWLRGGITWSPDGAMVAFSTKAGKRDAIHIQKVDDTGFDKVLKPEMDAIYSPDWSPDGSHILFSGINGGRLDLFTINVETEQVTRLTNDFFDEFDPHWSADGSMIVFASDRRVPPYEYRRSEIDGNYDIFVMRADGTGIRQITDNPYNDRAPDWSPDGGHIVFTSDRNGIDNLYAADVTTLEVRPLTNLLTGASDPAWAPDGTRIAFTSFEEGGWDIYILKRPLMRELTMGDLGFTSYRVQTVADTATVAPGDDLIFLADTGSGQELALPPAEVKDYKIKFSPDMFNAFASYNTFMGVGGMGELSMSDIMGNHRFSIAGDMYYSIEESNLFGGYYYLKHQTDWGIELFHYKTYYRSSNWDIFSDRTYGGTLIASRPFNRFTRLDLGMSLLGMERDAYTGSSNYYYSSEYGQPYLGIQKQSLDTISSFTVNAEFTNDTTLWSYTGPARGRRWMINIEYSPPVALNDLEYTTVQLDYRRYYRFGGKYNLVTRLSGGGSFGDDPRLFFLGGTDNWLNAHIAYVPGYIELQDDLYFSRFPQPLRGYNYYEFFGNKYFLTNFEFRFPFIRYLAFGWPLPLVLGDISGSLFTDIGAAWERYDLADDGQTVIFDDTFRGTNRDDDGRLYLDDIKMSYGFGLRVDLGFAVVRFDSAWKALTLDRDPKPVYYLSIGPDF